MTASSIFLDPRFQADPYPLYDELRERNPVFEDALGWFVVTRHDDAAQILRDQARWSSDSRNAMTPGSGEARGGRPYVLYDPPGDGSLRPLLFVDPPVHSRLRDVMAREFTHSAVKALRTRITEIVESLLEECSSEPVVDFVSHFAYPLPVHVICELLGVPASDHERFSKWSAEVAGSLDPSFRLSDERQERRRQAFTELVSYFVELIAARYGDDPGDDVLGRLLRIHHQGAERLGPEELIGACILLLVAGHETTVNLLSNSVLALVQNPDQLELVRAGGLDVRAVDELLRFDAPVQIAARTAMVDTTIRGVTVPRGRQVAVVLGAANRDPRVFSQPHCLDLVRTDASRHLGFGAGIHYCLGAALARIEAQVALPALVDRFDIEIVEVERRDNLVLRGVSRMAVRLNPRARH